MVSALGLETDRMFEFPQPAACRPKPPRNSDSLRYLSEARSVSPGLICKICSNAHGNISTYFRTSAVDRQTRSLPSRCSGVVAVHRSSSFPAIFLIQWDLVRELRPLPSAEHHE